MRLEVGDQRRAVADGMKLGTEVAVAPSHAITYRPPQRVGIVKGSFSVRDMWLAHFPFMDGAGFSG
jgi:hypothetical protein